MAAPPNSPSPTPEDPRQNEPIHDPPVDPEHDIERPEPTRQAGRANVARGANVRGGIETPDPSPDDVVFDAEKSER